MNVIEDQKHWARWILTSVYKHFSDRVTDIPIHIGPYQMESEWSELRFGGPYIDRLDRTCFRIECNVDFLLTTFVDKNDIYKMQRLTGQFQAAFGPICVFRYGDGPLDDQTLFGTLKLSSRYNNKVNVNNYGLVLADNNFQRSTIESDFELYFPDSF